MKRKHLLKLNDEELDFLTNIVDLSSMFTYTHWGNDKRQQMLRRLKRLKHNDRV